MASKGQLKFPSIIPSSDHINHLTQTLSTQTGLDATLATICYTSLFLSTQLPLKKPIPTPTPTKTTPLTPSPLTPALKNLYSAVEEQRIFSRLFGLFPLYTSLHAAWTTPHRDPIVKTLLYASLVTGTGFQVLENVALLTQKGVLSGRKFREWEGWCWLVSNRFWLAQLLLETVRLARVRQLKWREELGAEAVRDEKGDGAGLSIQSAELEKKWWRELYVTVTSIPLAIHWSFEEESSPVSEVLFAACGMASGVVALRDAWEDAAA
ncbi:hypothetical protein Q7P37_001943 [Cladosporium fusiforme]